MERRACSRRRRRSSPSRSPAENIVGSSVATNSSGERSASTSAWPQALLGDVGWQRTGPTGVRRHQDQASSDGRVATGQFDGQRTTERQPDDGWPIQVELGDEPGKAIGVASHPERLWRIRASTGSRRIPRDQRELAAKRVELPPPRRRAVTHVPVQQHHRRPVANAFVTRCATPRPRPSPYAGNGRTRHPSTGGNNAGLRRPRSPALGRSILRWPAASASRGGPGHWTSARWPRSSGCRPATRIQRCVCSAATGQLGRRRMGHATSTWCCVASSVSALVTR